MKEPDAAAVMRGFPVPPAQRVPRHAWDHAPWNRWSFQHVRELLPTAEVWRGEGPVWELPERIEEVGGIGFTDHTGAVSSIDRWLDTSFTDGFIFLYDGVVRFERYMNGMQPRTLHLSQSVGKSIVGAAAGIMAGRELLDPGRRVSDYLPELDNTAWRGAKLRHVLDMTTGVAFDEDYLSPDSDIAVTDYASGWKPSPPGMDAPACVWDQIMTLDRRVAEHGERFAYRSIEADVLGHCIERVAQTRLPEVVSGELWRKLGCEQDANFTVDPAGYALASGGFNACLRDYARFGQMIADRGRACDRQVVPAEWIDDITAACEPALFGPPYTDALPRGAYRSQFWIADQRRPVLLARGIYGQLIYVEAAARSVAVKLSSWPEAQCVPRLKDSLNAVEALVQHFAGGRESHRA